MTRARISLSLLAVLGLAGLVAACGSKATLRGVSRIPSSSPMSGSGTLQHFAPQPVPPETQITDGNVPPGILNPPDRYAQLFTATDGSILYVDAQSTNPSSWVHPQPGPDETIVQLPHGEGILTNDSPSADQILYNRIGTVLADRVPRQRRRGTVLLWTDRTLDYYGVALGPRQSRTLLEGLAAEMRPGPGAAFRLKDPPFGFTKTFDGQVYAQWHASPPPLAYGFVSAQLGEIDVTVTAATTGFVEILLGAANTPIGSHRGWVLASQTSIGFPSYTAFWHQSQDELVIVTSDGKASEAQLESFIRALRSVDNSAWDGLQASTNH